MLEASPDGISRPIPAAGGFIAMLPALSEGNRIHLFMPVNIDPMMLPLPMVRLNMPGGKPVCDG
ncbi:hypothetical protein CAF53_07820 [Sphingobium sp. LB126]|nr:hypothetical protein CAF53_07820 [Sphingobium sp. LB126]